MEICYKKLRKDVITLGLVEIILIIEHTECTFELHALQNMKGYPESSINVPQLNKYLKV